MSAFIAVKNFERFQHYRDRKPPWIKLYNDLLDDYAFCALPDASKWLAVGLWLLASRQGNRVANDPAWIARMVHSTEPVDLAPLLSAGFVYYLDDASKSLAEVEQSARLEEEAEAESEGEIETESSIVLPLRAATGRDEQVRLVVRAANRGMNENPLIGSAANPIPEGHGSIQEIHDWLDAGVSFDVAKEVCYDRTRNYKPSPTRKQPHSMAYFTGAVMDAWEKKKAEANGSAGLPRNGRAGKEASGSSPASRPDKYAGRYETGAA